jgi:outer membrane protein assembly factor BamB
LETADRFLAEKQWPEVVEAIRRLEQVDASRLIKVELAFTVPGFERYVPARDYCQWRLARLAYEAPEALAHYRRLVDPVAENWFREAEKRLDERLLERVAREAFASHFGDDALLRLGDMALARGDLARARALWQQLATTWTVSASTAPALRARPGNPLWLALRHFDFDSHGGELAALLRATTSRPQEAYPDTDLDPASIYARLVVASILEGSRERASVELKLFRFLYPQAEGAVAGRAGRYGDLLQDLFDESAHWPPVPESGDWPTFARSPARNAAARATSELPTRKLWSFPVPRLAADNEQLGIAQRRIADDSNGLLAYHPIVVEDRVLLQFDVSHQSYVAALDLRSGKAVWQVDFKRGFPSPEGLQEPQGVRPASDAHAGLAQYLGVARFTATASDEKIFTRMGSPVTAASARRLARSLEQDQGFLIGLSATTEGKPLEGFPLRPPAKNLAMEGSPLVHRGILFAAMRRVEGARSQYYVTAYNLPTTTAHADFEGQNPSGRVKWQTRICSSTGLGGGDADELTHLLLTRDNNRLYLNTNGGVIAAIDSDDGRLLWLVKYPRAAARMDQSTEQAPHLFRDLVPCLACNDLLICAPADCDRIFALEGATGQIAWALDPGVAADAMHLLGVADDTLLASGDYLYWIDAASGRLLTQFPTGAISGSRDAAPIPHGFGRGLMAGNQIWWPTRENILVFDLHPAATSFGFQPRLIRSWSPVDQGTTGGNLVLSGGILLIASADRLSAFGP